MRLMQPSPGEAYDRLTILNLKIKFARATKRDNVIGGFIEEQKALVDYLQKNHYVIPTGLADDMGRINTRLWDLEDAQRLLIKEIPLYINEFTTNEKLFFENARIILELNDARADTVQKINAACGINAPEKLYGSN